jgi:flagellar basal-body rod modification protein FlgD
MTITAIPPVSTAAAPAAAPAAPAAAITSDFTMFLKMLTVQMQNQDPLNPIDSTDYAVQLATFSGVEQQVRTNQLLVDMQTRFSQMGLADMAGWIGKDARSDAPLRFDGAPVALSLNPAKGASSAVLVVRDANGALVSREEIATPGASYTWLGADATGALLPPGRYSLSLESRAGEQVLATTPVEHYARVIEARSSAEGTVLVLEGGVEVAATRVTGLRDPQG